MDGITCNTITVDDSLECKTIVAESSIATPIINSITIPVRTLNDNQIIILNGKSLETITLTGNNDFNNYLLSLIQHTTGISFTPNLYSPLLLYPLSQTPDIFYTLMNKPNPFQKVNMLDLNESILNKSLMLGGYCGVNPAYYGSILATIRSNFPSWSQTLIDSIFPNTLDTKVNVCSSDLETDTLKINDLTSITTVASFPVSVGLRSYILARDFNNKVIPNKHNLAPFSMVFTDATGYLDTPIEIPSLPFVDLDPTQKIEIRIRNAISNFDNYYNKTEIAAMIAALATIASIAGYIIQMQIILQAVQTAEALSLGYKIASMASAGICEEKAVEVGAVVAGFQASSSGIVSGATTAMESTAAVASGNVATAATAAEASIAAAVGTAEAEVAASITAGEAAMLAASGAGVAAIVAAGILHLTGPKGDKGDKGDAGIDEKFAYGTDLDGSMIYSGVHIVSNVGGFKTTYTAVRTEDLTNKG